MTKFYAVQNASGFFNKTTKKFGKKITPNGLYSMKAYADKTAAAFEGVVVPVIITVDSTEPANPPAE